MKPRVREVIVVEGRYDRNTLLQAVDATVVEAGGFALFRDREKVAYLCVLAEKCGIILLTDADGAGFVIRNHLKGCLPPERVKQAYIPDVYGKERRKKKPGKEGRRTAAGITKADLLEKGLIGPNSREKRLEIQKKLGFPEHLTANGLLEAMNLLLSREEFDAL